MTTREDRVRQLKLVVRRVEMGRGHRVEKGAKFNFQSVAAEAEISASTIHSRYPEIAEIIRQKMGKAMRVQRDQKRDELKECKARNRALKAENTQLKANLASVTSRYATAKVRLKQLEANGRQLPGGA